MGIVMMVAAVALLTTMNVFVKLIGTEYHPTQITFIRNAIAMVVIVPFLLRGGGMGILKTSRWQLHFARSIAGTAGNVLFFFAFQHMTVGDVIVISQAVPLFVTIFAVIFLSERVGIRRWLATSLGFAGVIIAINPAGDFASVSLIAVVATALWATTILLMRRLGTTESPYTVAFYYMLTGALVTACFQPWYWHDLNSHVIWLFLGTGITGALGQILMSSALKLAKASVVSPFNYTGILWAVGFDLVIWGVIPAWTTLVGAAIITATGVYTFHRETVVRKKKNQLTERARHDKSRCNQSCYLRYLWYGRRLAQVGGG